MDKKIVPEHNESINLTFVEHFEEHEKRKESALFKQTKEYLHQKKVPCFINNGKCEGHLEIHHFVVEWAANSETDWDKVQKDNPGLTNVDQLENMMVLCEKHHRHKGFGIHMEPYPNWIQQKYMTSEALEKFEKAVKDQFK